MKRRAVLTLLFVAVFIAFQLYRAHQAQRPARFESDELEYAEGSDGGDEGGDDGGQPLDDAGLPRIELVSPTRVTREPGYLYFIRGTEIWRTPVRPRPEDGAPHLVKKVGFVRDPAYLYFLDGAGNVSRAKRLIGKRR